jgi:hypothetical protein
LRIAPAKLIPKGFEEGRKPEENHTPNIEADAEAGEHNPPTIKDFLHHRSCGEKGLDFLRDHSILIGFVNLPYS